jgi:hypothetical protein
MNEKISELKIKELLFRCNENEKFCKKIIEGIREADLRDDDLLELVTNVKKLLTIYIRYKKIEILTHKSAAFQYLLKNYTYKRFLKLDDMMKDNYNVNKRLYVNQKIYESLMFLDSKLEAENTDFKTKMVDLSKMSNVNEETKTAQLIYRYLDSSTVYLKELWFEMNKSFAYEQSCDKKIKQMRNVQEVFKKLYMTQINLNAIDMSYALPPEDSKDVDASLIVSKINMLEKSVDVIIMELHKFLRESEENNLDFDHYSNVSDLMIPRK